MTESRIPEPRRPEIRDERGLSTPPRTAGWLIGLDALVSVTWIGVVGLMGCLFVSWPLDDDIGGPKLQAPTRFWIGAKLPMALVVLAVLSILFVLHTASVRFLCEDRRARLWMLTLRLILVAVAVAGIVFEFVHFVVTRPIL